MSKMRFFALQELANRRPIPVIRTKNLRQVITAVADGALAVASLEQDLS